MPTITLREHTKLISDSISFEIKAGIKAAEMSKKTQDMENFLMAQSYVMGLQKAVELINTILEAADNNVIVEG